MKLRFALLLASAVAVLSGCPRPPLPIDFGPRGRINDPAVVLGALQSQAAAVRSVSGEAKAKLDTPEGGGGLAQFVMARSPASLRLESIDFFGNPVAVLTSDGEVARLFDVKENVVYEGPATASMVSRLLPIAIAPEALVSLLLGSPPLLENAEPTALEVDEKTRDYVLTIESGALVQLVGVDVRTLRPTWTRMPRRGPESGWRATFEDYGKEASLAKKVTLVSEDGRSKVELVWHDRELDSRIDSDLFLLEVPEGAAIRRP